MLKRHLFASLRCLVLKLSSLFPHFRIFHPFGFVSNFGFRISDLLVLMAVTLLIPALSPAQTAPTRKDAYQGSFLIGAAINRNQFYDDDPRGVPIIKAQFDSITPENILKW